MVERVKSAFDTRTWRLADLLAIALLVFNLGVQMTWIEILREWRLDTTENVKALQDENAGLRERLAKLEAEVARAR